MHLDVLWCIDIDVPGVIVGKVGRVSASEPFTQVTQPELMKSWLASQQQWVTGLSSYPKPPVRFLCGERLVSPFVAGTVTGGMAE